MNQIQTLYYKSRYFWIFSRVVLSLVFISVIIERLKDLTTTFDKIAVPVVSLYILITLWILMSELFKKVKTSRIVRYFSGGFLSFSGVVIIVMILDIGYADHGTTVLPILIVPIWIILLGLYDILLGRKSTANII